MNKTFWTLSLSTLLLLVSGAVHADNVCHSRAQARQHTGMSQARLAYRNRVRSCQTNTSPDRAERCIQIAKARFESDSQIVRARYISDVRRCGTET